MNQIKRKIVVAVTGASGSIYAKLLLEKLSLFENYDVGVVMSENAKTVWQHELLDTNYENYRFQFYHSKDFNAPFASGSSKYDTMVIIPCSMGTLGRIANGVSNDLTTRAADVMLKERRKLVLAVRETPYNLLHINNMKLITEAGGIVCPTTPSFYSQPKNIIELATTVVDRILDLIGIENETYRWSSS